MITIIDYGMGNLGSVFNAFHAIGVEAEITSDPTRLTHSSGIVLPGVGAFGDGMKNLKNSGFVDALNQIVIQDKRPFLGVCLGQQLLGSIGFEYGENPGLNWIPGPVQKLIATDSLRLPHIGWNDVRVTKTDGLYKGLGDQATFYFVHTFALQADPSYVSGYCDYGTDFVASIEWENISATQFHPEKSHKTGLALLRNWHSSLAAAC